MANYRDFSQVFPPNLEFAYGRDIVHSIETHRKTLDGVLFIDRVLKALGLSKAKIYPPKNDAALRQLHQQICEASMSTHHKLSLFYYVLLDFDTVNSRLLPSEKFSSQFGLPMSYYTFMKGLWHMDREQFATALEYIAHPSLVPDFADEIVTALVRHTPDNDYSLVLSYYHAVQPILKTSAALSLLFEALAKTSISEALLYSRTHSEHTREALFYKLVEYALDGVAGQNDIAFFPLDKVEEKWFEEYLTEGDGHSLKKAKDTVLVRKIVRDQLAEAGKHRVGGQWGTLLQGIRAGLQGQEE
ncbi:nuclear pore complex assembly-domain-containing protein [Stachybotrys elegans]|uniref:Nuclear pore complex assembly-domain-containing protein n=1 Tax=Stachybotrys elegans TaxID=80388 RepID=A0A8K0T0U1_9HYPO|nr:nuclear pore complex assembly-domain-containing protein [Stachybotrys elegans]